MLQAFPTIQCKVQKLITSLADLVLCWLRSCDFFSRSSDLLWSSEAFSLITEFSSAMTDSFLRSATSSANTCNKTCFKWRAACVVHRSTKTLWEEDNQLDATQCSIRLVICSTCFGHVYAHYQELVTIPLLWHVAYSSWLLVVGRSGAGQQAMRQGWGML